MFRTLIINTGEKITVKNNWLIVSENEEEKKIPLSDIYSIVIDNPRTTLTIAALNAITQCGAHVLFCDESHLPVSHTYPMNGSYAPFGKLKMQIEMTEFFKGLLWKTIIQGKIQNQAKVLSLCKVPDEHVQRMLKFRDEVDYDDVTNREGIAAKWFFNRLYGAGFVRDHDNTINAALNYGYTIIRSSVAKTLAVFGFSCTLGIHHINRHNGFNLADDLMEPLRPLVDLWVDQNQEELVCELTKENRRDLVNLVNHTVLVGKRKYHLRYALTEYISSLTSAIAQEDVTLLKIPEIQVNDIFFKGNDGE
ncbi:type II CRISPR-associated endonuclease Cas1 [Acetobacterium wieringae]|uniref:type II CRISPR-associated endonuclease Cas1 n=1 Tax=Acetobacterium wieringae TaxID=52694 RepID=UPI002033ECEE|nr:type II CRISPR-associated endonuclease Cas1 [Acetobacterium wieringae]URN84946.1 type II CRISPR-associated endonuclease Cas1 [Acetobacterium wieringae]